MKELEKRDLLIFIVFTLISLSLFWRIFLGDVNLNGNLLVSFYAPFGENLPFKNIGWDQLRTFFPFYKFTFDSLKNFSIPLWNPYAFSGHPHLADFLSAVFYPLNFFGLFLPQIEFWHLLRISPMILASFFTFLFLRSLKLSRIASFFGAFSFGFSPFILTWGEEVVMSPHSIVWLPLILFAFEKFRASKNKIFLLIISISTASTFLSGYIQTTIYLFIFVAAYLLLRSGFKKLFLTRFGWKLIGSFILGTFIAAVQLIPSAELFFNSARSEVALKETLFDFLIPIESFITLIAPDFYGHPATANFFRLGSAQYYEGILFVGVAVLIFATYEIFWKSKGKLTIFLAVFVLISFFTVLDLFTSKIFLSLPIPFLSSSIPNRILFLPAFCLAALGALGMDNWLVTKDKNIIKIILLIGSIYLAIIVLIFLSKYFDLNFYEHSQFKSEQNILVSSRNLVIPLVIFMATSMLIVFSSSKAKFKKIAVFFIIIISILHIFRFSQKYFSFTERANIYPDEANLTFIKNNQEFFRSWSAGTPVFENNFATQYSIYWPEGYDSLNNRNYGEFTHTMQGNKFDDFVSRADAGIGDGSTSEQINNPNRRKLIDLLGIKYVIARNLDEEILLKANFKKVFSQVDSKYSVFENKQVLPRAFLASNYEGPPEVDFRDKTSDEIKKERRKLIPNKLLSDGFNYRDVIILEDPSTVSAQFGDGTAEIVSYKPNEVVIRTSSDQPKILYLSDNMYPGWRAEVDGNDTEILRANYTFRAVPLIPGDHTVRFYFDSFSFKLGVIISILSLSLLGFLILRRNRFVG